MIRGLYTVASAMVLGDVLMNVLAHNLANASTDGFHRQLLIQQGSLGQAVHRNDGTRTTYIGDLPTGVVAQELFVDTSQGSLVDTGHSLDFALEGEGFFVVQTPRGLRYTRCGAFTLTAEGLLVTKQGYRVQGEQGDIYLEPGTFQVSTAGEITQGDDLVARLQIVRIPPGDLQPEGHGLYATGAPERVTWAQDYMVVQGSLEQTNVSVIEEMVKMISAVRAYETAQRMITAQDEVLGHAVEIGKVS